jgi:TolB-like protein/tetratricopeptide (TPR) repeat protein
MSVKAVSTPNTHPDPRGRRLESWKEIAAYLGRDVTTVRRWERREGLPVYRILHSKLGSVYAYTTELDAWRDGGAGAATDVLDAHPVPEIARQGLRARRWLVVCGVAILVLLVVAYFTTRTRLRGATGSKIKSLAVLPLKNLSGDPAQEYFADGMTEEVIGRLSAIRDLRVISRTSVMQFKETRMSIPEIAKALHVDAIVEGSVIREGGHVRVHAQLIRGASDEHFWSEEYDREVHDILALQSDVARSIAEKVAVTVTGQERSRLVTARQVSPEVYESYLKGMYGPHNSRAEIEQRIANFEDGIGVDPTFAPAYVGLAGTYIHLQDIFVGAPPAEIRPKAISAVRKALELDPDLAEAHAYLAEMYQKQWKWAEAEAEYRRALELKPNDAVAHRGYADWLACQGRTEEALAWAKRGRELDPQGNADTVGWHLLLARRYDESIREYRSVLAVHPDSAGVDWGLGFALIVNNQPKEAIPVLETAVSIMKRSPGSLGMLATAHARAGNRREALRLIDELKHRRQKGYVPAGAFVDSHLAIGDYDQAFFWCDEAYKEQSAILQWTKVHPLFDPVRGDPRFKDLVHRLGLDQPR